MKGSQGITTDVNICFINYEMIKTHMIKTNYGIVWIKITFIKWMHISCLIYHFLEAALFWDADVSASFWFFLLTGSHIVLYSHRQMRRDYKIKFTDKSKANLYIFGSGKSSPSERVDFSVYHFLSSFSKSKQYFDSSPNFGCRWSWV